MRVLVIGGTGFIGTYVVRDLVRLGHDVKVLHRGEGNPTPATGVRSIVADRTRLGDSAPPLREFAPDVVVDVILSSGAQAQVLMDVFRGVAKRVVALSSIDVYRACGVLHRLEEGPLEPVPLTEDSALRTKLQTYPPNQVKMLQQIFGWLDREYDKIPVERAVLGDSDLPGTVLRLPMVYGPGDRLHRFYPMLKRMDDRRKTIVMQESWARWRAPRGYVENVSAAIALAATSDIAAHRIYNVAEPESFSELEWTERIARVVGWNGKIVTVPEEKLLPQLRVPGNLMQHWSADSTRIRAELGYEEPIALDEALRRTIEWERANPPEQVDPNRFDYAAEDAVLQALGA